MDCARLEGANKKSGSSLNEIAVCEDKSNLDDSSADLGKVEIVNDQKQDFEYSEGQAS